MKIVRTPKGNEANVVYTYDGIPTDGLIPLYQGYTVKDTVIIQPHLKDNLGLLVHELTHVDQWNEYVWFNFRYNNFNYFRFNMEAEAFANQVSKETILNVDKYAYELSTGYNLNKSKEECYEAILKYYRRL